MSGGSFWACSAPFPRLSPAERLAAAMELARFRFVDGMPTTVHVHPETAAEAPLLGDLEFTPRAGIGRFDYWFPVPGAELPESRDRLRHDQEAGDEQTGS